MCQSRLPWLKCGCTDDCPHQLPSNLPSHGGPLLCCLLDRLLFHIVQEPKMRPATYFVVPGPPLIILTEMYRPIP